MNHNDCRSMPTNRSHQVVHTGKVYTEPHLEADNEEKIERTPLKNSACQNKMNKTAKVVKLRCVTKADTEPENRVDSKLSTTKIKTQHSQENVKETYSKKESKQTYGKLKKNMLKPAPYKSNRILQQQKFWNNKASLSYTSLLPNQRKRSLSHHKKMENSRRVSKEDDNNSSKSNKKIEFTLYQSQKCSQTKIKESNEIDLNNKSGLLKHIESVYSLPYPCTTSIVIDLFNRKSNNKLNASNASFRGKSQSRQKSNGKQSNRSVHKSIEKDPISIKNQERIENTLEKLKKFQIVNDYADRGFLQNLLRGYILAGEAQCKWVLLVIDEVFKKIRNPLNNDKI